MIATIIILCMYAWNLGIACVKHGEPKRENYNFWITLIATVIGILLFYWAGLFENFK